MKFFVSHIPKASILHHLISPTYPGSIPIASNSLMHSCIINPIFLIWTPPSAVNMYFHLGLSYHKLLDGRNREKVL